MFAVEPKKIPEIGSVSFVILIPLTTFRQKGPYAIEPVKNYFVMKIACPNCDTKYALSAEALGDAGRKMKCAKCAHIWLATVADAVLPTQQLAKAPQKAAAVQAPQPVSPQVSPVQSQPVQTPPVQASPIPAATSVATDEHAPVDQEVDNWKLDLDDDLEMIINPNDNAQDAQPDKSPFNSNENMDGFKVRLKIMANLARDILAKAGTTLLQCLNWARGLHLKEQIAVCVGLAMPFLIMSGLLVGREKMVRTFPDLASLYATIGIEVNLRGLIFEDVRTVRRPENGVAILVVEGTIRNTSTKRQSIPKLHFILSGRDREVYAWQDKATQQSLEVGEFAQFRTVLASPPDVADELHVRFFNENPHLNQL
ncbi:MAG: hypothetical protein COA52_07305 [Hyphomicrobiales bacterium]|nr:MAG: hypothetical protein COA52_07305 [Hyphomicrobiales bacterium]